MSTAVNENGPTSTTGSVNFLVPPTDPTARPYVYANADATGEFIKNYKEEGHRVVIENLRGKEDSVTLDSAGFQYFRHASKHKTFVDDEEIKREYYPESVELIKKLTGATRVVLFDHSTSNILYIVRNYLTNVDCYRRSCAPSGPRNGR